MMLDLISCEDGHAQERTYLNKPAERVAADELWIADRNFCTVDFLFAIHHKETQKEGRQKMRSQRQTRFQRENT